MSAASLFPLSLGATQDPILVVDTCAPQTFVGIASQNHWLAHHHTSTPALEGLFDGLQLCLETAQLPQGLASIHTCLYCTGPGSTLGLRVAHMAFQTWNTLLPTPLSLLPYHTFDWVAHQCTQAGVHYAHILSEYKNQQWQYRTLHNGSLSPLTFCNTDTLLTLSGPFYHVKRRLHWPPPPLPVTPFDPSPALFFASGGWGHRPQTPE